MTLASTLNALVRVILDEARSNVEFDRRLKECLGLQPQAAQDRQRPIADPARKGGRRSKAVIDPVQLARGGEGSLRSELVSLDIEQLRDIVAEYGMDTGKLVMKWKSPERVVDRIVEIALGRAAKGSAFREPADITAKLASPREPSEDTR